MTCDLTSFLTVSQSYQDDGKVIVKSCVQWNGVLVGKISVSSGHESGTAMSEGLRLTTELPGLLTTANDTCVDKYQL